MEGFYMKFLSHRKLFYLFALFSASLLTILIFASLICTAEPKGIAASTPKGQTLYTQFSLFYEGYCHVTTNYRKGILVPVNTEVKFVRVGGGSIIVALPDGHNLEIRNIEAYSGENIDGIFTRTFATKPVDLLQFTEEEKKSIIAGEVQSGMRKSAVIIALGFPPKHKTPNLQLDQWQYWHNRFATFVVHFEKDQVTQIEN
jgi:hypothetical protein